MSHEHKNEINVTIIKISQIINQYDSVILTSFI